MARGHVWGTAPAEVPVHGPAAGEKIGGRPERIVKIFSQLLAQP